MVLAATVCLLMVTGCGNSPSTATARSADPLTPALKLALGTLRLEGTDQAVDAPTAAQLLPLWQLLDELSTSSAAAPAETAAVIEQIEATMTPSQRNAIQALKLTDGDVAEAWQGSDPSSAAATTAAPSSAQAAVGPMLGGEMGVAGMPLAGGAPIPGASLQRNGSSSASADPSGSNSLIKEVIQLLKRKSQD